MWDRVTVTCRNSRPQSDVWGYLRVQAYILQVTFIKNSLCDIFETLIKSCTGVVVDISRVLKSCFWWYFQWPRIPFGRRSDQTRYCVLSSFLTITWYIGWNNDVISYSSMYVRMHHEFNNFDNCPVRIHIVDAHHHDLESWTVGFCPILTLCAETVFLWSGFLP